MKICKFCKHFMPEDGEVGMCDLYDIRMDDNPFDEDISEEVVYTDECDDFEAKEEA